MEPKDIIAKRIAMELNDGDLVNLGIGLPLGVANFIPEGVEIFLQSENGIIGLGPLAEGDEIDDKLTNAGAQPSTILPYGMYFDTAASFGIIRGGHVDVTVLGALEVDQEGSLASWIIPGKLVPGMGGAMDLVVGAKKVIIATTHTNKGVSKIKKKCSLPLTAYGQVNMIVTELAVMEVKEDGLHLVERHPDVSIQEIIESTEANLIINDVKLMNV
ncbi:MAG: 3-oxoacid CoA-transferase subunit B [Acholeplasmataceae bacterium]|jgi:3-oxoacid CoA-transferase B subunit|nr:3-oxoacid CoA-transferase subunit B [Acholeplasmataceae bacterium]